MIAVEYTAGALRDVQRLADFLLPADPIAAQATADLILDATDILCRCPEIGRRVGDSMRELVISRGRSGYLALYHYAPQRDLIVVTAVRHQREAGYKSF